MPEPPSIRRRLLIWIGLPFTLLALLALFSSHLLLSRQINDAFDELLFNAAKRLEQRIYTADGELHLNMHYFSISTLGSYGRGKIFYRVRVVDGDMIAGFRGLEAPATKPGSPTFYDTRYAGNTLRAVAFTFPYLRGREPLDIEVIVAESQETRYALTQDFMVTLGGLTLIVGLLAISLALLAIHRGLAPLNAIRQALHLRSPNDLHPVDAAAPREILPLIQSINHLMQRMRRSIESIQQLNADVSHQLRTPISEIRALAELAKRESGDTASHTSFNEIQRIAEQASHDIQQLLAYAKTRSELVDSSQLEPVDLATICQAACSQTATAIYQKSQELAFEHHGAAPIVRGDAITLAWLVVNLIENASLHAGGATAYRGAITLTLHADTERVTLCVSDAGVGVDPAHLERLTERFYRANLAVPGSGLGLAIAEQIAAAHSATLDLRNRPAGGLEVRVTFPALRSTTNSPAAP